MQTRTSTVRFQPMCSCPRTELARGFLQDCSAHPAPSTSRGFRSTINFATSSSARGLTTVSSWIWTSSETALTSPITFTTANGSSLVGLQYSCSYAGVLVSNTLYHGTIKHNIKCRETWASHLTENRRDKMLTVLPPNATLFVSAVCKMLNFEWGHITKKLL